MVRKTTLERKNKAMADQFLTLESERFERIVNHLTTPRDADKDGVEISQMRVRDNAITGERDNACVHPGHIEIKIRREKRLTDSFFTLMSIN